MKSKNKVCPFCNQLFSTNSHLIKCEFNKDKLDLNSSRILFIESQYNVKIETIIDEYINKEYSLPDLKRKYGIDYKLIYFILELNGFKVRTVKESNKKTQEKIKVALLEKYGVDNISKVASIKEQKKLTFLANYGVDNVYKSEEFKRTLDEKMLKKYGKKRITNPIKISESRQLFSDEKWLEIDKKIKQTNNLRYGVNYITQIAQRISKLELIICDVLKENNISFVQQKFIKNYSYDILLTNQNILIEVNGDFWHANPLLYKENDILQHPGNSVLSKDLWKKDKIKRKNAEKYKYKVLYIWELDIKNAIKNNNLEEFILNQINNVSKD